MGQRVLLSGEEIAIIIHRLSCQLAESHLDFSNTVLIGMQPRGTFLADRILSVLDKEYAIKNINLGYLDTTFFRDDFRSSERVLHASKTKIDFIIENKKVVLIDDVLYTGRSVNSALMAIQSFGRPSEVELLTLIDRRFSRHLPIQPNYRGRQVDVIDGERVTVLWKEKDGEDIVYLIEKHKDSK